jgi:hypothetical protein
MTHRADQIIDRIVTLMPATAAAFKHRTLPLSDSDGELPANSVCMGADTPPDSNDGFSNLAFIDSSLIVDVVHRCRAATEEEALVALVDMRRDVHVALMADDTLGLAFVIGTYYSGADEPERDAEQDRAAGRLVSHWRVHYRMNITDPA